MYVILHMSVITQDGISALMLAAGLGKTEVVVELVKAGANVDIPSDVRQFNRVALVPGLPCCVRFNCTGVEHGEMVFTHTQLKHT